MQTLPNKLTIKKFMNNLLSLSDQEKIVCPEFISGQIKVYTILF